MSSRIQRAGLIMGIMFLAVSPASGGPPPNPTPSDANGNTAGGTGALRFNTGSFNTAFGYFALSSNTSGSLNTASGTSALNSNTTGDHNTASGFDALSNNTTGVNNTASGTSALGHNTIGVQNTAFGYNALNNNNTGSNNTALGQGAGFSLRSGNNNLYLSHPGVASESNTMRLGRSTHTRAFIAGVFGKLVTGGTTVHINNAGQLGTVVSSARYKQDIQPMSDQSQKVHQLRPVTFHYKEEPTGPLQYGLIAEEVAKVYPELVTRGKNGEVEGVRYEELTPMLLNELQQQHHKLDTQTQQLETQAQQLDTQTRHLYTQAQQLQAVSQQLADLKTQNDSLRAAVERMEGREAVAMTDSSSLR